MPFILPSPQLLGILTLNCWLIICDIARIHTLLVPIQLWPI